MKTFINTSRTLPEILKAAGEEVEREDKIKYLKHFKNNRVLQWYVNSLYNVDFSFIKLSRDVKGYKPCNYPVENTPSNINRSLTKICNAYQYYKVGKIKHAEKCLLDVLETVHKDEAELVFNLFDNSGKKVKGVSKSVFKELFPNFFPDSENA